LGGAALEWVRENRLAFGWRSASALRYLRCIEFGFSR
jgi:hypothetical protein